MHYVAQAARELEVSGSLLRTWIAAAETAEARGKGIAGALEEKRELERLRKLVAEQAEELEIIKNPKDSAMPIFMRAFAVPGLAAAHGGWNILQLGGILIAPQYPGTGLPVGAE